MNTQSRLRTRTVVLLQSALLVSFLCNSWLSAAEALGDDGVQVAGRPRKPPTSPKAAQSAKPQPSEQSPAQEKAKPSQPGLPTGFKSNREFGEFLKWPTPQNPEGGPMPSAEQLKQRGITRQDIQRWQEFYEEVGRHNSGNPSADPRIEYLEKLKKLLN